MNRNLMIIIVVAVVLVLLACCCVLAVIGGVTLTSAGGIAALLNAPAPYGIDSRPTVPASATPGSIFPATVSGYKAEPAGPIANFAGAVLPEGARIAVYTGAAGKARVIAVQTTSEAQARELVGRVKDRAEGYSSESILSRDLPGKPAFVQWHVSALKENAYGVIWNNGAWVFVVVSTSEAARDAVAGSFPY